MGFYYHVEGFDDVQVLKRTLPLHGKITIQDLNGTERSALAQTLGTIVQTRPTLGSSVRHVRLWFLRNALLGGLMAVAVTLFRPGPVDAGVFLGGTVVPMVIPRTVEALTQDEGTYLNRLFMWQARWGATQRPTAISDPTCTQCYDEIKDLFEPGVLGRRDRLYAINYLLTLREGNVAVNTLNNLLRGSVTYCATRPGGAFAIGSRYPHQFDNLRIDTGNEFPEYNRVCPGQIKTN